MGEGDPVRESLALSVWGDQDKGGTDLGRVVSKIGGGSDLPKVLVGDITFNQGSNRNRIESRNEYLLTGGKKGYR